MRTALPKQTYLPTYINIYPTHHYAMAPGALEPFRLDSSRASNRHIGRYRYGAQPFRMHQDSPSPTPDISADYRKRQNSSAAL